MIDIERRALLGDRKAQEECTQRGIALPCPMCGESQEIDFRINKVHHQRSKCLFSNKFIELDDWNTRAAPPIGRCKDCKHKKIILSSIYCDFDECARNENSFCIEFEPKEDDGNV